MKGLIIKDLCIIKNQMKSLLLVLGVFVILSIINKDASFILFLVPFYMVMILITTFSYDEFNNWERYCNSLPLSRNQIVKAKYLLFNACTIILLFIGFIASIFIPIFIDNISFESLISTLLGVAFGVTFVISLLIPFYYRFGSQKGRIMVFISIAVLALLIALISKANIFNNASFLTFINNLNNLSLGVMAIILLLLMFIIIFISYQISLRIYNKKEF